MKILTVFDDQTLTNELRKLGHEAFSASENPTADHPEWHFVGNPLAILKNRPFFTQDGTIHNIEKWDLLIASPSGKYLANSGNKWFDVVKYGTKAVERRAKQAEAAEYFMRFANAKVKHICVINPVGVMSTIYRKPDQYIQPYFFGIPERQKMCLWFKGLSNIVPTDTVEPDIIYYKNGKGTDSPWHMNTLGLDEDARTAARSRMPQKMAKALAEQLTFQCMNPAKNRAKKKKAA